MSTQTLIKPVNRFVELARLGEVVFHTDDLANLWQIINKNTLYTTIKRYVAQGLLFQIYKGFYAIKPLHEIDPLFLGLKALHRYGYVSTETILREQGIIQQELPAITLITDRKTHFSAGDHQYYARALPDQFLYQPDGITVDIYGIRKAGVERAVVDLLYFNPTAYFDRDKFIDWKKVKTLQNKIGYPLTPHRYV